MTDVPPPPPSLGGGKDPLVILLVNLLAGAGYFFLGQKAKGITAVVLWLIVGVVTCGSGAGVLSILYAVDGFFQARQTQDGFALGPWTFFTNHR